MALVRAVRVTRAGVRGCIVAGDVDSLAIVAIVSVDGGRGTLGVVDVSAGGLVSKAQSGNGSAHHGPDVVCKREGGLAIGAVSCVGKAAGLERTEVGLWVRNRFVACRRHNMRCSVGGHWEALGTYNIEFASVWCEGLAGQPRARIA